MVLQRVVKNNRPPGAEERPMKVTLMVTDSAKIEVLRIIAESWDAGKNFYHEGNEGPYGYMVAINEGEWHRPTGSPLVGALVSHRWESCNGNSAEIHFSASGRVYVVLSGRRHGIPAFDTFRVHLCDAEVVSYETTTPEFSWHDRDIVPKIKVGPVRRALEASGKLSPGTHHQGGRPCYTEALCVDLLKEGHVTLPRAAYRQLIK